MRRRLKTAKKTKKEVSQKKPKKKAEKAQREKDEKKIPQKAPVAVRILGRPKKEKVSKDPVIELEIDKEKELEKKIEKERQAKLEELKAQQEKPKVARTRVGTEAEIEYHKKIIMWSGIAFFMVLVSVFWISNTKKVVEESRTLINQQSDKKVDWDELVDEISDKIVEMKSGLQNIENFNNGAVSSSSSELILKGTGGKLEPLSEEEFKKIDENIEPELKNKIKIIY